MQEYIKLLATKEKLLEQRRAISEEIAEKKADLDQSLDFDKVKFDSITELRDKEKFLDGKINKADAEIRIKMAGVKSKARAEHTQVVSKKRAELKSIIDKFLEDLDRVEKETISESRNYFETLPVQLQVNMDLYRFYGFHSNALFEDMKNKTINYGRSI